MLLIPKSMGKKLLSTVFLIVFGCSSLFAQDHVPQVLGYLSGQSVTANDSTIVSFHGGSVVGGQHQTILAGSENIDVLAGMRYGVVFAPNAFDEDLFVSKGYFPDFIKLTWEIVRLQSQVTGYKIFRRELGSNSDYIQVANLSKDAADWEDEFTESGVLYEYKLKVEGIFPAEVPFLNVLEGIGFRLPSGKVSGRVTFEGGGAVEDVLLIAETDDDFDGSSLQLNGSSSYLAVSPPLSHAHFQFQDQFTFQTWLKPTGGAATIMEKGTQYKLAYAPGQINFIAGGTTLSLPFTEKADTFFHVSAVRTPDSLKLYVIYDMITVYDTSIAFAGTTTPNDLELLIGKNSGDTEFYQGYIDEVRVWHKALDELEVLRDFSLLISGTEDSLSGYYRMNEAVGDHFYDLSRQGFDFNEKHGFINNATWSDVVPTNTQLSVKGVTDANGNYLITGIPYSSDGSTYRIVPLFGVHSFDPTERLLFIGPGSNVYSDINFLDVASFTVRGSVFYKDTKFPVEGVQVKIDGQIAVTSEGNPITTDVQGAFSVDVPIGEHSIQLVKSGHVFRDNGRFPPNEGELYDFQQDLTIQQNFIDTTLVKLIGKVVGGPIQGAKINGLEKSINNIGNAKITLSTLKERDLTDLTTTVNGSWANEYYQDSTLTIGGTTMFSILSTNPENIEIYPDPVTGEYEAYLLPETYTITGITAGTYTFSSTFHSTLDLESGLSFSSLNTDSSLVDSSLSPDGTVNYVHSIDSIRFHKERDFVLRVQPTINVKAKDGTAAFWDKTTVVDGTTVDIVDGADNPLSAYPVFSQRNRYSVDIEVFEEYTNSGVVDEVPVTDGVVEIQNELAIVNKKQTFEINDFGVVSYVFYAGLPNITTGGIGNFLKPMNIVSRTGTNNAIATPWEYNGETFKGYVLGGVPSGSNFVTTGPNEVDMILRDPQGSESYAYYEVGSSSSTTTTSNVTNTDATSLNVDIQFGAKITTFAGVGAGIIQTTEFNNSTNIGFEKELTWIDNNTSSSTTTTTQRWQTSAEPFFVGAPGDVFIGHSTNIVYGETELIKFLPESGACEDCVADAVPGYSIGRDLGLRLSPEFGTAFMYSQDFIVNILIPNLESLRNTYLGNSTYHNSKILLTNSDYGKKNTTGTLSDTGYVDGDSYNFTIPAAWPDGVEFVDTVAFYNEQIKNWKNLLARNEQEKLNAELVENLSFDSGVLYESSTTYEASSTDESTFEFTIAPSILASKGFSFNKAGATVSLSNTYTHTETETNGNTNSSSVTFGYVLKDDDEGDFYSIDVAKPTSQTGPVFKVRGGQSSCPYQDAEITQFHQPGTIFSEATQQREVPLISVENAILTDVPEDQAAIFNVQLSNASESDDDFWFTLAVNQTSNMNGADIRMDGGSIGDGKLILINPGETVNKIITVEKVDPSEFKYENLELVLHSICQYDPTDNIADISDTVTISAYFQPVCSPIELTSPQDRWLINTSDIVYSGTQVASIPLAVDMGDYNLSHSTFEQIVVQHRASSQSQWTVDMVYYYDPVQHAAAAEPKALIDGLPSQSYILETKSFPDRNYEVQVKTVCADGTENLSEVATGIKDIKRPKLFGTPQPADGILSAGDDILITFDEDIQESKLVSLDFEVKGVLNGGTIGHNSVVFFDGVDDHASVVQGVNLQDKSFTVEFWTERLSNTPGAIFAQGGIELGFNAGNQFYATLGGQTFTTSTTYTTSDNFMHWAVSFDHEAGLLDVFVNAATPISDASVTSTFSGAGRMYMGRNMSGTSFYHGYVHDFRVWERAKGQGVLFANKDIRQSGDEIGLSGFWPMDEAAGEVANDLSRSHHAILQGATWSVFPRGYVRTFNGSSDNISMPSGTVIVTNDMDMTMEFWMKAGPQTNTVIFSNGKGDLTDPSPDYDNIWVIGSDASGKLFAMNKGVSLTVSDNVFDQEWHHIALVLKRNANTSLYVDGNQKSFDLSTNFGGFAGGNMALGARMFTSGGITYDQHFTGSIDEFRFWNLARTRQHLELDMNAKLVGDEAGLLAYYPFEKYDDFLILRDELTDCVTNVDAIATGGTASNTDIPNITDARPVQKVAFDWVVNEDQIVINILEPAELIEKTVLEITVNNVQDLNGNRLASPITWTAFVKKNTVVWEEQVVNHEKLLYDQLEFTVDILNQGGTEQNYTISNIPSWLIIDEPSGTLPPDSEKTLTLTVSESINIGTYEHSLYLGSDFGFDEKFDLNLKVLAEAPDWTIIPGDFQYNMSVIGILNINGFISTNPDDMIAAFVNDTLRGVASLNYIEQYDMFEFFLDIFSDQPSGETIEFQVWNASEGKIHVQVTPEIDFIKNTIVGMPSAPEEFFVVENVSVAYPMKKGWNWVSFNLESDMLNSSNDLFDEVNSTEGDIIKGLGEFDQYGISTGWIGSITGQGGFDLEQGYKMKISTADTFYLVGESVKSDTVAIDITNGWNWIGFPSQLNMSINDAMSNVNFDNGDFIKGQEGFAFYDEFLGWIGSLKFLRPTEAYMINSGNAHTLTYPDANLLSRPAKKASAAKVAGAAPWTVSPEDYANNMSITIETNLCTAAIDTANDYIGVFVGSECRGLVKPTYLQSMDKHLFFLTVYANANGETLTFKYYNGHETTEYTITETEVFSNDAVVGTIVSPSAKSVERTDLCQVVGIDPTTLAEIHVYPNPFEHTITIESVHAVGDNAKITITDIQGRTLKTIQNWNGSFAWDGRDDQGSFVLQGVYLVSVQVGDAIFNTQLIKTN